MVPLSDLALAPYIKQKLQKYGYTKVDDLFETTISELEKNTDMTRQECTHVVELVAPYLPGSLPSTSAAHPFAESGGVLAVELLGQATFVSSCSASLDRVLGGGARVGSVVELCGVPGIGKTQIAMQLCVSACLDKTESLSDKISSSVVYIDTEGSFCKDRYSGMVRAALQERNILDDTESDVLDRLWYFRVTCWQDQVALMNTLSGFVEKHKGVRLVVVDSVAAHFRHAFVDVAQRTRLLSTMAQSMSRLAEQAKVAVVSVNQVTTSFVDSAAGQGNVKCELKPCLGSVWEHMCASRCFLYWSGGKRMAYMEKSYDRGDVPPEAFCIDHRGVR